MPGLADAHVHVFDRASREFPREVSPLAPAERTASVEQLLHEMNAARIERAVLIQMGRFTIEQHRYVAHPLRRWPARFAAAGLADLDGGDTGWPRRTEGLVRGHRQTWYR